MALLTELLKLLNSEDEPLPKRLKLAENTFCTVEIPIARREDTILKWLCSIPTTEKNVWNCLCQCLQMKHVDIKSNIKKSIIELLIQAFHEDKTVCEDTFECCKLLLSNPGMRQYFTSEVKDLGLLVGSLLDYVDNYFKQDLNIEDEKPERKDTNYRHTSLVSVVNDTVINALENLIQIFKSFASKQNDLRTIFMQNILCSLCNIIDHTYYQDSNRLRAVAYKCVQHMICEKKYMHNMQAEDNNVIMEELSSVLKQHSEIYDSKKFTTVCEFIFQAAVGIYKLETPMLDMIFRKLIESAGIYKKEVMNSLLKHLNDLTLDFDHEINGITLSQYCQKTVDDIISTENITCVDYVLLTQLAYFNPLLIEKRIQDIFKRILLQEHTIECAELFIAIVDASVCLRREEKLISQIFMSLRQLTDEPLSVKGNEFFPKKFKEKFSKSVNNVTNLQAISMLRSLIFHLNVDCMKILESNESCKNIAVMKATVELLVALLDGICLFENTTLLSHKKFVRALTDLGSVLSSLIDKALQLKHNKKIIVMLLTVIISWNEAQNVLKYYASTIVTEELMFPISSDCWNQLIQRITNFGERNCKTSMNYLILHRLKMSWTTKQEICININELIGGLEYFWDILLKYHIEFVPCLRQDEIKKLTSLLLNDMMLNLNNFNQWVTILKKECLQESKNFILSLLQSLFIQIGNLIPKGTTKSIIDFIHRKCLLEIENDGNMEMENIFTTLKEELQQNEWVKIPSEVSEKIEILLKVLSEIPLVFLSNHIRTLTFVIVFSVCKECNQNKELVALSNNIFLDLVEKPGIDIFQYLDPQIILADCPRRIFQKAVEHSFRNGFSYKFLKNLIKFSICDSDTMYLLLESMQNTRPKLNIDNRILLKKAEAKLMKAMLNAIMSEKPDVKTVKALTLMLKVSFSNENVNEKLINIAGATLCNIFTVDTVSSQPYDLLEESLQLAVVIARNPKTFQISDKTIQGIWHAMLEHPCKDLLLPLLALNAHKQFHDLMEILHAQMVKDLLDAREDSLRNIFDIWHAILKTDMSTNRNKVRLAGINKLFQTIQISRVPEKCWPNVIKLLQNILNAKHLYLADDIIDLSLVFGLKAIEEVQILACGDVIKLCTILIKVRTNLIADRLPILLLLYRRLICTIVHSSTRIMNKVEEHTLRCLAMDIEKCTSSLIKLKKDMIRLSPYVIADLLEVFSKSSIPGFVKISVQNCISQLISICDQHGIALLSRTLPASMQEIFKVLLSTFNKFYKFSGKI